MQLVNLLSRADVSQSILIHGRTIFIRVRVLLFVFIHGRVAEYFTLSLRSLARSSHRLFRRLSSSFDRRGFEVIFVPLLESFNQLLLGVVDGIGGEHSITFKLFELDESLSVIVFKSLEFFDLIQLLLIDNFIFVTVGVIDEAFSAGVDIGVHRAVDRTLLTRILLVIHELSSIINLALEHVAAVSLRFDIEASVNEVGSALNNGLLDLLASFLALVFEESCLLVDRLSLFLVLGSVAHSLDHHLLFLLLD
jgi:hypothetical protein